MSNNYQRKTSDIFISDDFRKILENFRYESIYADYLLKTRIDTGLLVENHVNYLSVANNDMQRISYITPDRIRKVVERGSDIWKCSARFTCKPGAFLNKIFRDVPPKEVEKFASLWKTFAVERNHTFEIVTGDAIRSYYGYRMHERQEGGSLGVSCLRHDQCQDWFRFYIDNPEVVSLLVLLSERGRVIGRALLWETSHGKIMDRIYTMCDEEYSGLFQKWAKDHGYSHKVFQNWANTLQFQEKDLSVERQVEIKLKSWMYDYYPYLDTFKWLDCEKGMLYNYCPDHFQHRNLDKNRIICSPHGVYERTDWLQLDEIDRAYAHSGDMHTVDGVRTHGKNLHYSELYNRHILRRDSLFREDINSYVYSDDSRNDQDMIKERLDYYKNHKSGAYGKKKVKSTLSSLYGNYEFEQPFFGDEERVERDPVERDPIGLMEDEERRIIDEDRRRWEQRNANANRLYTRPTRTRNNNIVEEVVDPVQDAEEALVNEIQPTVTRQFFDVDTGSYLGSILTAPENDEDQPVEDQPVQPEAQPDENDQPRELPNQVQDLLGFGDNGSYAGYLRNSGMNLERMMEIMRNRPRR